MTETMTQWDVLAIVALLPITAVMTVWQKNPYHALVVRGILGAIAALVYALFGAADVALTEALVGTMLAITLYAVAVRSSLELRLGIVGQPVDLHKEMQEEAIASDLGEDDTEGDEEAKATPRVLPLIAPILRSVNTSDDPPEFTALLKELRGFCGNHFLRLELFFFPDREALEHALAAREIHAIATEELGTGDNANAAIDCPYRIVVRVQRLYDLMQVELNPAIATLKSKPMVEAASAKPVSPPKA